MMGGMMGGEPPNSMLLQQLAEAGLLGPQPGLPGMGGMPPGMPGLPGMPPGMPPGLGDDAALGLPGMPPAAGGGNLSALLQLLAGGLGGGMPQ